VETSLKWSVGGVISLVIPSGVKRQNRNRITRTTHPT